MFFYNPWVRKWGWTPSGACAYSFHRWELLPPPALTPSTACGRSPSLEEGGLGASRSLSKPLIQPRVQGRNPARFNGGYGVPRGFKGEKSKSPPNPLGLAERVPSSADDDSPFSKQQQHNQQLQTHLTVAIPEFLPQNTVFPKNRLLHFICFICFMCPVCVGRKKIFGVKATGSNSFHRRGRSPSLDEGGLGFRRSRPPALPSIGYRGFAVAPITLRAPSRNIVVITVQINGCGNIRNGRAMRAPTVYGDATDGCKCIQPLQ